MKFKYTGMTREKKRVQGLIDAEDTVEVRLRLKALQVRPEQITPADSKSEIKISIDFELSPPINLKGLIIFTRQFSSLIDSGVPIVQCLEILAEQDKRKKFKAILLSVRESIESGNSLFESLGKHPKVFSALYVAVVEAGEMSGTLDKSLRRLGVQLEKLGRIKAKVVGALMYPALTMVVAMAVIPFFLLKVLPEVTKLYGNQPLPELTQTMMHFSTWVSSNFSLIVGAFVLGITGIITLFRMPTFREVWDPFWLKVPVFGSLTMKSSVARIARTVGTLLESGVPVLSAFNVSERVIENYAIKKSLRNAQESVTEGRTIVSGLTSTDIFPAMVIHMIRIGEITGKLDELLHKIADIFDDEVDDAVDVITTLIQPLMLIILGFIVAFLLTAMYLPILSLAEKVAG